MPECQSVVAQGWSFIPQIAPILWLLLFFYFIVVFLIFISNFYFTYSPVTLSSKSNVTTNISRLSWQW